MRHEQVSIDQVLAGRKGKKLVKVIEQVEITVQECQDGEDSKSDTILISSHGVTVNLREHYSWKKVTAAGGSIGTLVIAGITYVFQHLPAILAFLQKCQ